MTPMVPCVRCQQPLAFGATVCPKCGQHYQLLAPGQAPSTGKLGDEAAIRALIPVGRTGLSIAAGYVGLISMVLFFLGPIAILLGILAIRDLNQKPGSHGMGRAVFAIVGGAIGTAILAAVLVLR